MYSLLRYPGGKTRAVNILKKYIPRDTKEICSPFFGGGSFEISLARQGIKVFGYDNFKPLVCFWQSVLYNREKLYKMVESFYPLSKEKFYSLQKEIRNMTDEIEIGAVFYVLNRCSFSGTGLRGGMSLGHPRFTKKGIESLLKFDMSGVGINCLSFEESIPLHPDCLIYADPPYLINQSLYGNREAVREGFNHELLAEILNKRGKFILSYNNIDEVKELYKGHSFLYPEWKYGMGKDKKSKEILIISRDLKI